eukprot:sb/3469680/
MKEKSFSHSCIHLWLIDSFSHSCISHSCRQPFANKTRFTGGKSLSPEYPGKLGSNCTRPTDTSKQPIRTYYLGHVTGYQPISYQPIRDQYFLIRSVPVIISSSQSCNEAMRSEQEPIEISKQRIRTRYLGHLTGYQPIRDQYFLIWSVSGSESGYPSLAGTICTLRRSRGSDFLKLSGGVVFARDTDSPHLLSLFGKNPDITGKNIILRVRKTLYNNVASLLK